MQDYILSCGSTADLSREHFERRAVHYICFHYTLDGEERPDDLGQSITFPDFYGRLRNGSESRTSMPGVGEFESYFRPFLLAGKDILHVSLSSGISGELNSARIARETLLEEFPERRIEVVDSLSASSGYGLLMDELADARDAGKSLSELRDFCLSHRLHVQHWFFSTDLSFYFKGGRISRTAFFMGQLLSICPILHVDREGKLIPMEKVRTKKRAIEGMLRKMEEYVSDGRAYAGKCYMSHSDCYGDARILADRIEERFPKLSGKVLINNVGTTIGSHTGPGTVALFFIGAER